MVAPIFKNLLCKNNKENLENLTNTTEKTRIGLKETAIKKRKLQLQQLSQQEQPQLSLQQTISKILTNMRLIFKCSMKLKSCQIVTTPMRTRAQIYLLRAPPCRRLLIRSLSHKIRRRIGRKRRILRGHLRQNRRKLAILMMKIWRRIRKISVVSIKLRKLGIQRRLTSLKYLEIIILKMN